MATSTISVNLDAVRKRIEQMRGSSALAQAVTLIAVSKTHPAEAIETAISAGQREFGENRIQEALAKWPPLKAKYPGLILHGIGPLQTNKVKDAVALFDVIHTVDRPKLAEALAKEMEKSGRRPDCFIEVNTGAEPQKSGVPPQEAAKFVQRCKEEWRLPIAGLMCIPPLQEPPAPHFALLRKLAEECGLPYLSMGMSSDYGTAIRLGATHVRIGTAIFGERAPEAVVRSTERRD